jgi:hypothetical protein
MSDYSPQVVEKRWTEFAEEKLVGKKIVKVEYMSEKEAKEWMWYKRPLIMHLDDGTQLMLSADDEGNDGGAMFGFKGEKNFTFPVI